MKFYPKQGLLGKKVSLYSNLLQSAIIIKTAIVFAPIWYLITNWWVFGPNLFGLVFSSLDIYHKCGKNHVSAQFSAFEIIMLKSARQQLRVAYFSCEIMQVQISN